MSSLDRRTWFRGLPGALAGLLAVRARAAAQASKQQPGAADPLRNPDWVGSPRDVVDSIDNDGVVTRAERRLRCVCRCGLDVFTCRTTDFTCTYSPELHREVLVLVAAGSSTDQVVEAFVARYGETILMAPKARGFGVLGYWLPSGVLAAAAALLGWVLVRRSRRGRRPAALAASAPRPEPAGPSPDDLARIERALREIPR